MSDPYSREKRSWKARPEACCLNNPVLKDKNNKKILSTSSWSDAHVKAFHVVFFDPRKNTPIIPLDHLDKEALKEIVPFWKLTEGELRVNDFARLKDLVSTMDEEKYLGIVVCMNAIQRIILRRQRSGSVSSNTSDEAVGKDETDVDSLARSICWNFVKIFADMYSKRPPSWDFQGGETTLKFKVYGNKLCSAKSDGMIFRVLDYGEENKRPCVWVEDKTLKDAPERKKTGYRRTLPQKAGEAIAVGAHNHLRTVFGIEFSHRYASFWRTDISPDYYKKLKTCQNLPLGCFVKMKRGPRYDLAKSIQREGFATEFFALLGYLKAHET